MDLLSFVAGALVVGLLYLVYWLAGRHHPHQDPPRTVSVDDLIEQALGHRPLPPGSRRPSDLPRHLSDEQPS